MFKNSEAIYMFVPETDGTLNIDSHYVSMMVMLSRCYERNLKNKQVFRVLLFNPLYMYIIELGIGKIFKIDDRQVKVNQSLMAKHNLVKFFFPMIQTRIETICFTEDINKKEKVQRRVARYVKTEISQVLVTC